MSQNRNHQALDIALHWQHDGVLFNDWIHLPDYRYGFDRFALYDQRSGRAVNQAPFPNHMSRMETAETSAPANHRLKDKHLQISAWLKEYQNPLHTQQDRPAYDIDALLFDQGIGVQMQFASFTDDDFNSAAMSRLDEGEDLDYFAEPDLQPYWPLEESRYVSNAYNRELASDDRVLDLMAGIHSPLQESSTKVAHLNCAGLNRQELQLNPICDQLVRLNVNTIEKLPYESASFDAILLHAAIEYVINPEKVFAEIYRVLKSEGKIIISFNRRTEQQKAIRLWRKTMDFEHLAIVAYYLRQFARCDKITAESHRHINSQQGDISGSGHPTFIVCGQRVA